MLRVIGCIVLTLITIALALLITAVAAPDRVKEWMAYLGGRSAKISRFLPAPLPERTEIKKAIWLEQNWSNRDRFWFHHTSQGTATIPVPYDWFISLEQPELFFIRYPRPLSDPGYLARFGFIPSLSGADLTKGETSQLEKYGYRRTQANQTRIDVDEKTRDADTGYPKNRHLLPVGFAKLKKSDGAVKIPEELIGFTCAACHTGHLEYKGVSLRFDGGPAMLDLEKLEGAIGLSIAYARYVPWRFGRFADKVLTLEDRRAEEEGKGDIATGRAERKKALKAKLDRALAYLKVRLDWRTAILDSRKTGNVKEGFGRLDALNRIGNQVFFENLLPRPLVKCAVGLRLEGDDDKKQALRAQCAEALKLPGNSIEDIPMPSQRLAGNLKRIDAPVSFPPIWGVPWFSWAQYDASVLNELVRNAGEALGVSAVVNTAQGSAGAKYSSSVKLENIYWMERMLRGEHPLEGKPGFKGLTAPKWPAAHFPGKAEWQIDEKLVDEGRKLYATHCVECHRGPVRDPKFDQAYPHLSIWQADSGKNWIDIGGEKYLDVVQKPVRYLGTDPQQANVLSHRKIYLPDKLDLDPIEVLNRDRPHNNCGLPEDPPLRSVFALALMGIVDKTVDQWFLDNPEHRTKEGVMRGGRPNCPNPRAFRHVEQKAKSGPAEEDDRRASRSYLDLLSEADETLEEKAKDKIAVRPLYRARPLDGIWATAPYLHNGSVPNLDQMLRKASDRVKEFCVGSRQFDPKFVGLRLEFPRKQKRRDKTETCPRGLTRLKTDALGSSNAGHSFEGDPRDDRKYPLGVVGPELDEAKRKQLIEYLKTL